MSRIYRIDDSRTVRARQRVLPKGTIVEVWPDVFQPGTVWIGEVTKELLEAGEAPLTPSATVEASRISIFCPDEPRKTGSLPSEETLRVRVLAGHGIAVTWYGSSSQMSGRPLPEPTSPEDTFFWLMKMGSSENHVWRLFRTREEAIEFMARQFPEDTDAGAWAEALQVTGYASLLSGGAR